MPHWLYVPNECTVSWQLSVLIVVIAIFKARCRYWSVGLPSQASSLFINWDEVLDAMLCFRNTSSRYRRQRFVLECLCLKFIYVSYFVIFVLFVYQWSKGYCVFLNRNRGQYFLFWTFCAGFYSKAASIFLLKVFVLKSVPNGHSNLSTISDKKSKQ